MDRLLDSQQTEDEGAEKEKVEKAFAKAEKFQKLYLSRAEELLLYNPQKPKNDAKSALENISTNTSQTSIGIKFKTLAGIKF